MILKRTKASLTSFFAKNLNRKAFFDTWDNNFLVKAKFYMAIFWLEGIVGVN